MAAALGARILVSVSPKQREAWLLALAAAGPDLPAAAIGSEGGTGGVQAISQTGVPLLEVPMDTLLASYEEAIPRRMGQAGPPPEQ